jgi:hypothetical protein
VKIFLALILACFSFISTASYASCSNGPLFKDNFAFQMHGSVLSGGYDAAIGVIDSSGKCTLTGNMYIDINGNVENTKLTGSYAINSDLSGTLSLTQTATNAPLTFVLQMGRKNETVYGLETDSWSLNSIVLEAQGKGPWSNASLSGTYAELDIADTIDKQIQVAQTTYDGAGNFSGYNAFRFFGESTHTNNEYTGIYDVNADGTFGFVITGQTQFATYGVLYNNGTQIFNISDQGNGVDLNYGSCIKH